MQKSLGNCSGWISDAVKENNIRFSNNKPSTGRSFIKLTKELDHPRKILINNQNIDEKRT